MNETLTIIGVFVQPAPEVWLNEDGQFVRLPVHEFELDRVADESGCGVLILRRISDLEWGRCTLTDAVAWGRAMRRPIRPPNPNHSTTCFTVHRESAIERSGGAAIRRNLFFLMPQQSACAGRRITRRTVGDATGIASSPRSGMAQETIRDYPRDALARPGRETLSLRAPRDGRTTMAPVRAIGDAAQMGATPGLPPPHRGAHPSQAPHAAPPARQAIGAPGWRA